jgi:hypothetical protein
MKTEHTPAPSAATAGSAARPEWKTPKHLADEQERVKCATMTVAAALPSSVNRIGYLKDRDAQLLQLLDYLQSLGIPMGSDTWALRTLLHIRRLEAESAAGRRVLVDLAEKRLPDLERMRLDYEHARALHTKFVPPAETHCDWCGWPSARRIGGGYAACEDCLPNTALSGSETQA